MKILVLTYVRKFDSRRPLQAKMRQRANNKGEISCARIIARFAIVPAILSVVVIRDGRTERLAPKAVVFIARATHDCSRHERKKVARVPLKRMRAARDNDTTTSRHPRFPRSNHAIRPSLIGFMRRRRRRRGVNKGKCILRIAKSGHAPRAYPNRPL